MASKYICLLRCGHSAYYDPAPRIGEEVYCRRCNAYTKVKAGSQEYAWHCPVCKITRPHGTDDIGARRSGRTHQRKYHHVVELRKGYEVVELLGPEGQGELSVAEERIEWVKTSGHQSALRALVNRVTVQNGQSKVDDRKR